MQSEAARRALEDANEAHEKVLGEQRQSAQTDKEQQLAALRGELAAAVASLNDEQRAAAERQAEPIGD